MKRSQLEAHSLTVSIIDPIGGHQWKRLIAADHPKTNWSALWVTLYAAVYSNIPELWEIFMQPIPFRLTVWLRNL